MPFDVADATGGRLFSTQDFRWRLGVRTLAENEWLQVDDARQSDLALKEHLHATRYDDVVLWQPGSESAARELLTMLEKALHAEGLALCREPVSHPIETAGRSVQEDLCLLEHRTEGWVLTAGSVCFPTLWALTDKIGKSLDEIHVPVPRYPEIAAQVDRFFDRMTVGALAWRLNWSLVDDGSRRLDIGRRQAGSDPPPDIGRGLHLRVERQTLRRLVEHDAICFGIRVHSWPLAAAAAQIEASRLGQQLATMPLDIATYKNLEGIRAEVGRWLVRDGDEG